MVLWVTTPLVMWYTNISEGCPACLQGKMTGAGEGA